MIAPRERSYPEYIKLDLDPNKIPKGYGEKSVRCVSCGLKWPALKPFEGSSVCCKSSTIDDTDSPDISWSDAVHKLQKRRFDEWYEKFNSGLNEDEIDWISDPLEVIDDDLLLEELEQEIDEITYDPDL